MLRGSNTSLWLAACAERRAPEQLPTDRRVTNDCRLLEPLSEFPDLVVEIALTSGGLNKLEIYRRFAVPEVWLWRKGALEVWTLRRGGAAYDGPAKKSRLLPGLDLEQLRRCLGLASWREARRAFRDSLRKQKR